MATTRIFPSEPKCIMQKSTQSFEGYSDQQVADAKVRLAFQLKQKDQIKVYCSGS